MKTTHEMTEAEGFRVIRQMIGQAKQHYSDDSFHYLLWGWLVFAASLGHYIMQSAGYAYPYIAWLLMPVGGVIAVIYGKKQSREQRVVSYMDDFMKYVVIGFVVSLAITLLFMSKLQLNCYPMLMTAYGVFLFTSGGLLKFKPLMAGGFINWILAIVAFFVSFEMQLLLLAAAVLAGYIIPGYMLRSRYKKSTVNNIA